MGTTANRISSGWPTALVALLCLILGIDQLLLWLFLGLVPAWAIVPALCLVGAPAWLILRQPGLRASVRPGGVSLAVCIGTAMLVMALGGEGHLFYADTDWQVRYAVLRDLALDPWPFVYAVRSAPDLLRAPLGIYLLPALSGKWLGYDGAQWTLFVQNAAILALILILGGSLFRGSRERSATLVIFVLFSGMDIVGQVLTHEPLLLSSQRWNVAVFTSHLEGVFGGPQHALAGWLGAILFLLWRDGRITLAALLTPIPFLALWSPLATLGMAPFALYAGVVSLRRGDVRPRDMALPALSTILALPSLAYLAAGSSAVGGGGATITLSQYLVFELIEVGPYLLALAYLGWRLRFGGAVLALVALVLLVTPLIKVSTSSDFVTRVSIPALAILSVAVADALVQTIGSRRRLWRGILIGALCLGAATPAFAIARAVIYPPAPEVVCSYFGVVPGGAATYVTPLSRFPRIVAPTAPARIVPHDPARCWQGKWPDPQYHDFPERVAPADWDERL